MSGPDLGPIIAEIRRWHRERMFAMEQRKRIDLSLGAYLRTQLGWSRALPEKERAEINQRAKDLADLGEKVAKGKAIADNLGDWAAVILASVNARSVFDTIERQSTKEMESLVKHLPVWSWAAGVRGFGALGLATILAEAGDIGDYTTVSKLWKRLGLAVIGGVRQGGLPKSAGKDEWIAHGYNRKRRSRLWNIGESLVKGNADGEYRTVYLARKAYERERAEAAGLIVLPAAKIVQALAKDKARTKADFMSHGHIDSRGQRYMEKRLVKHLWQAWRRDGGQLKDDNQPAPAPNPPPSLAAE